MDRYRNRIFFCFICMLVFIFYSHFENINVNAAESIYKPIDLYSLPSLNSKSYINIPLPKLTRKRLQRHFRTSFDSYDFKQSIINTQKDKALNLLSKKKYKESYDLFSHIQKQSNDDDIRFYSLYSLFLMNKINSCNYDFIISELGLLEKNGYSRPELTEIKDFINCESAESL